MIRSAFPALERVHRGHLEAAVRQRVRILRSRLDHPIPVSVGGDRLLHQGGLRRAREHVVRREVVLRQQPH